MPLISVTIKEFWKYEKSMMAQMFHLFSTTENVGVYSPWRGILKKIEKSESKVRVLLGHQETYSLMELLLTCRSSRPEVFCKKGALRNFAKFTAKHLCQNLFFRTVLKMRIWLRCIPMNLVKFPSTTFFRGLLNKMQVFQKDHLDLMYIILRFFWSSDIKFQSFAIAFFPKFDK